MISCRLTRASHAPHVRGGRVNQMPCRVRPMRATASTEAAPQKSPAAVERVQQFLKDCSSLGLARIILVGDGSILETVTDLRATKTSVVNIANKGPLVTLSCADKTFEAHLLVNRMQSIKLARSKAKAGDWDVFAARIYADDGQRVLLTMMLHGKQGVYSAGAVEAWEALKAKYGDDVQIHAP